MLNAIGPWRLRSSGAHCDPDLAKRIDETLGEADWGDRFARHLAKRIGEEENGEKLGENNWREDWGGGEGEGGGEGVQIKSSHPHLADGEY